MTTPSTAPRWAGLSPEGRLNSAVCACGTGIGAPSPPTRFPGIRAAVVHDVTTPPWPVTSRANVSPGTAVAGHALDDARPSCRQPAARRHDRRSRSSPSSTPPRWGASRWTAPLAASDPEVDRLLDELTRQTTTLQLIASENFTSTAVLAATGSVLTNKYAEGYPGRRYYGGNQVIDEVEELPARATALFGAEHANVQPHAGANANLAVYQALLDPATRSWPCASTTADTSPTVRRPPSPAASGDSCPTA